MINILSESEIKEIYILRRKPSEFRLADGTLSSLRPTIIMLIKGLNDASVYRSFIPHVTANISSSGHNGMPLTPKIIKLRDEIFEQSKHLAKFVLRKSTDEADFRRGGGRTFD
jgi:hypothetical protein